MPAWRIPPPTCLRMRRARRTNSWLPATAEPTGAPSPLLKQTLTLLAAATPGRDWTLPLASGDDYELCFCLPPDRAGEVSALAERVDCHLTRIGRIREDGGLQCLGPGGTPIGLARAGFDHFAGSGE